MRSRIFLFMSCMLLFVAAVSLVQAEEEKRPSGAPEAQPADAVKKAAEAASAKPEEKTAPAAAAPKKEKATPVALTMEAIQELEQRKLSLDAREKALEERARDLELQEKLLKEKLRKMEELNKKMAERLDTYQKDHGGRIAKLVAVVEGMKPDAAAQYVEALDPDLAVEILARMKEQRASKILNLVDKKKGARLTELYTGYRDSVDEPAPAPAKPQSTAPTQQPAAPQAAKEDPVTKPM